MTRPLVVLVLSDGKRGHESQSYGLVEALRRLTPVEDHKVTLRGRYHLRELLKPRLHDLPRPDLVVAAGHRTHGMLIAMARATDAPCVLLMKPTLPTWLFDLCFVPYHDLRGRGTPEYVVPTRGALNRVPPPDEAPRRGGLILLGGPSSSHRWDSRAVRRMVTTIVGAGGDRPWRATDSRRTPVGELSALAGACQALAVYPHAHTGRDWLPQRLSEAAEVWVTEDSVSMIYEALSSGARVGLLPVPRRKPRGRVVSGIDRLAEEGYLTRFDDWRPGTELKPPPEVLQEATRCARIVLQRFFPSRLADP